MRRGVELEDRRATGAPRLTHAGIGRSGRITCISEVIARVPQPVLDPDDPARGWGSLTGGAPTGHST